MVTIGENVLACSISIAYFPFVNNYYYIFFIIWGILWHFSPKTPKEVYKFT